MKYVNKEMRVDTIIQSFNQNKINLIPPFQRGTVWGLPLRQALLANMVQGRPIPAIFLYKQPDGSQFAYNILDGKQRLESLILFVGSKRDDMRVDNLPDYFFRKNAVNDANFKIQIDGEAVDFASLEDSVVRAFREYSIATIEIDLDDEGTTIDEIVSLFVDINQYGVKVSRFEVVKALGKDELFKQVRGLLARQERRGKSVFYKAKNASPFVYVLKRLGAVNRITDNNARVERMWERLTEVAMFLRTKMHRRPADVLKAFIKQTDSNDRLDKVEMGTLRGAFEFLVKAYKKYPELQSSKLATDQAQFYTVITTIMSDQLLEAYKPDDLARRLSFVNASIAANGNSAIHMNTVRQFTELSARGTADADRRQKRSGLLLKMIEAAG